MPTTLSVVDASGFKKAGVRGTAVLLAIAWLVPFAVHRLPWNGSVPLGAHLLPMFWAAFVGAYFYGRGVALIVGLFAPLLNFAFTGLPAWRFQSVLCFELVIFALVSAWAVRRAPSAWVIAPLAYLTAKLASTLLQAIAPVFGDIGAPLSFLTGSVLTALPGLVALALINFSLTRYQDQQALDWDER